MINKTTNFTTNIHQQNDGHNNFVKSLTQNRRRKIACLCTCTTLKRPLTKINKNNCTVFLQASTEQRSTCSCKQQSGLLGMHYKNWHLLHLSGECPKPLLKTLIMNQLLKTDSLKHQELSHQPEHYNNLPCEKKTDQLLRNIY